MPEHEDKPSDLISKEKAQRTLYDLGAETPRVTALINDRAAASLESETAIYRRLLELWLSKSVEDDDFLTNTTRLTGLLEGVKSMVSANHTLQKSRGSYLDETQVLALAETFLKVLHEAVLEHISDEATRKLFLRQVSQRVLEETKAIL